jgi:hypothetical protein
LSFDKDDFWDIDKLLPKKKSAKPFSTGEKLALHEISGEEKKCDAAERKITLIDRGVPTEETNLAFAGNCLKGGQRGFAYEMPILGNVVQEGGGFLWQPKNNQLRLQLDVRT